MPTPKKPNPPKVKSGAFSTKEGTYKANGKKVAGPYGSKLPKEEKKSRVFYDKAKGTESSYKPGVNKELKAVKKSNKSNSSVGSAIMSYNSRKK
jgi:hypothetical protein